MPKKKSKLETPRWIKFGSLVCFLDVGCCFLSGSDVSRMFWTSVVQAEQMNKKVDLTCLKSHCKSRHFSSKAPTKKGRNSPPYLFNLKGRCVSKPQVGMINQFFAPMLKKGRVCEVFQVQL